MAVKLDNTHTQVAHRQSGAQPEVASCVSGIIEAFTNGLNIFKRLRERRKKRKERKEKERSAPDPTSDAEKQLSKSLKKGPQELVEKYAECYHSGMGPRFAKGDAIAHASLAETLIKLNTGLVGIIAQFLNHDAKGGKSNLDLDYKSLTHLSDASRREALQSMTQLYHRLSTQQLHLYGIDAPPCPRCGTTKHHDCSSRSTSPEKSEKRKHSSSRQKSSGPVVTRMPIKSSSHPQLVVMRPKTTRKQSSSSNNSSNTSSTRSPASSRTTSPLASPQPKKITMAPQLPLYVPVEPFELTSSGGIKSTLGGAGFKDERKRIDSFDDPRQPAYTEPRKQTSNPTPKLPSWTQYPYTTEQEKQQIRDPLSAFTPTPRTPTPRRPSTSQQSKPSVPPKPVYLSPPPPMPASHANPATLPFRRRLDKMTPSSYTFTTTSTQLGEIPQRNWTRPYDYEEAERMNKEAEVKGYPGVQVPERKEGGRKKRFGFLRRDA